MNPSAVRVRAATVARWDATGDELLTLGELPREVTHRGGGFDFRLVPQDPAPALSLYLSNTPSDLDASGSATVQAVPPKSTVHRAAHLARALLDLPENWNSYGALRVRKESVTGAGNLLLYANLGDIGIEPQVVPTNNGGVQLEWVGARGSVEVTIEWPKVSVFVERTNDLDDAEEIETEIGALADSLRNLIGQIA